MFFEYREDFFKVTCQVPSKLYNNISIRFVLYCKLKTFNVNQNNYTLNKTKIQYYTQDVNVSKLYLPVYIPEESLDIPADLIFLRLPVFCKLLQSVKKKKKLKKNK